MPQRHHKGRGAVSDREGRFATRPVEFDPDEAARRAGEAPQTVLKAMQAGSIISHNDSPDVPFDHSINPYQGCEHGCIYCYARPSHSYLDLSPGLDFETRIFYKPNAARRLLEAWEKPGYECQPITIGANTDPYQPAERSTRVTRSLLELFNKHRHPVNLITKGTLTGVVDRLEEKGLVERWSVEGDGRKTIVALTRHGERVYEKEFPRHIAFLKDKFDGLSAREAVGAVARTAEGRGDRLRNAVSGEVFRNPVNCRQQVIAELRLISACEIETRGFEVQVEVFVQKELVFRGQDSCHRLIAFADANGVFETRPKVFDKRFPIALARFPRDLVRQGPFGTNGRARDLQLRYLLNGRRQACRQARDIRCLKRAELSNVAGDLSTHPCPARVLGLTQPLVCKLERGACRQGIARQVEAMIRDPQQVFSFGNHPLCA